MTATSTLSRLGGIALLAVELVVCNGSVAGAGDIANPAWYLAQSRNPDGDVTTPLRESDPIIYRRFDCWRGSLGDQRMESFLTVDGGAITTWSYGEGVFIAAEEAGCPNAEPCRKWGGEKEVISGGIARITQTQDNGTNGIQTFALPWVVVAAAASCDQGWTIFTTLSRGCLATITYPATGVPGNRITADTIITEHGDPTIQVERIFLAKGWGRLLWQALGPTGEAVDPSRFSGIAGTVPATPAVLRDVRLNTNIVPAGTSLTPAQLWHPTPH